MLLEIRFVGLAKGEPPPHVALFLLQPHGEVLRKVAVDTDGKIEIDPAFAKEALAAWGPDVEDPSQLEGNALMQFRPQERLPDWLAKKFVEIPQDWWVRWRWSVVCVNGRVRKCSRLFPPRFPKPLFPFPGRCLPICNGVVEIYERTCCCRPPILVDIPHILEAIRAVVKPGLRWPPPPPPPEGGKLVPEPPLSRAEARELKRAEAFDVTDFTAPPNEQLRADLLALEKMQPAAAVEYLNARDYLYPIWCRCTSRKVGEAVLGPDGRFHFCYRKFASVNPLCRTLYYYKVRQWQDTQWVTIYDGAAARQFFTAAQFAEIATFLGRACGQGETPPTGPKPNVMLQDIGAIHTYNLVSHYKGEDPSGVDLTQIGQYKLATPDADAGLVNPPYDAPLGEVPSFRAYFHPGLKGLGAVYYRLSIVAADANGAPAGGATPAPITNAIAWLKFVALGGHYSVEAQPLGPNTKTLPGGTLVTGLYQIPYDVDAFWLGGQYHQYLDTRTYANGRYLMVLEIFDKDGNRLRPAGVTDAGTDAAFEFQRWLQETGPKSTATVPFGALTHILWIDNRPVYADIEDLRKNHVANTQECQFLTGPGTTEFSVGFRAFHAATADAIPAPQTFMDSFRLYYHRGLNGPTVLFETGDANQPGTLLGGPAAESVPNVPAPPPPTPPLTFGSMLGANTKCTFAVNLEVYAKHTNGIRQLSEYNRYDEAAFALEITP